MHRLPSISFLLISSDAEVQEQLRGALKDASLVLAKDLAQASKQLEKREFDAVLIESKRSTVADLTALKTLVEGTKTVLITGSRRSLRQAVTLFQGMVEGRQVGKPAGAAVSLEDLIQSKVSDFVKGMRNGSARNLYPILMSAVERPLLTSTLRETQGNQIQAARLLGLNRNTLRKKIVEHCIPLSRTRSTQKVAS